MTGTKYGKYILKDNGKVSSLNIPGVSPVVLEGLTDWGGIEHRMKWSFVTQPVVMVDAPHSHDFDEFLCFYSSSPADELDFGAEVELSLGVEGEIQIIDTPTVVCIPKGLVHCPVNFKSVNRPVLFVHIYISPQYVRKPVS